MLWLPVAFLTIAMLVVGTAFALLCCSVAFAGWSSGTSRPLAGWEMPTMSGERLRKWAANLARRAVARHAHLPRSAETPLAIATEVEAGANAVLEQAAQQTHTGVATSCPNTRPRQIAVTAPELFAITADLERRYPRSELQIIREVAVLNSHRAKFVIADEFAQAGITCPLRTKDGHCLTFTSRPIACRRLFPGCPCESNDACSTEPNSGVTDALQGGITNGLSEGLRQAGLDGGVYELNDALATALSTPHAAKSWAHGEAIFANCAKA